MTSTRETQARTPTTTERDPFARLRERGLVRDPVSNRRQLDPPTIEPEGGSVTDIVERWR